MAVAGLHQHRVAGRDALSAPLDLEFQHARDAHQQLVVGVAVAAVRGPIGAQRQAVARAGHLRPRGRR